MSEIQTTGSALEQRLAVLRQAFASDAMIAFRPMATQEVMRVLRGTASNAKGRADKQALSFDHKAVSAEIEALATLTTLAEIEAKVSQVCDTCDSIPKQEAGSALLPLSETELAELAPIHEALLSYSEAKALPMLTVCSQVRRALLTWRQVPKQEGPTEDSEPEEGN